MRITKILLSTTFLLGALFFIGKTSILAQLEEGPIYGATEGGDDFDKTMKELEKKKQEYEKKIKDLQQEENSLQKQIDTATTQIYLTQTEINIKQQEIAETEKEIRELGEDISDLKNRIAKLKKTIAIQQDYLSERMRARYKTGENSYVIMVFGSDKFNSLLQKTKFLKVMEYQDKKLIAEMDATKAAYNDQKDIAEDKKKEAETLQDQLERQQNELAAARAELDRQKADKETLLRETQNDEQKYQSLLAQVESEMAALNMAINLPEGGEEVKKGDIIGLMGNTGCSSGPHVHFGFIKNSKAVDPLPYLNDGHLKWPVSDWQITQGFGANYWFYMNNFGIPGHDALDIVSRGQWSGAPIKAARDGKLRYAQDARVYCPWLNNSIGKGAIIDHGDGEKTIYWHLQ